MAMPMSSSQTLPFAIAEVQAPQHRVPCGSKPGPLFEPAISSTIREDGSKSLAHSPLAVAAVAAASIASGRLLRRRKRSKQKFGLSFQLGSSAVSLAATNVEVAEVAEDVDAVSSESSANNDKSLLTEAWEKALDGRKGSIWTEPEVFAEFVGSLNESPGDSSEGTVRFEQVSASSGDKDLLLYVPGVDFAGAFAAEQFRGLTESGFELWRCFVGPADRTPFVKMESYLEAWVRKRIAEGRRVVLLGESFGGLLSLAVALKLGKGALKGLVLVNPATSFGRTVWPLLGRALSALPKGEAKDAKSQQLPSDSAALLEEMNSRALNSPYAYLGSMALTGTVADGTQLSRIASRIATRVLDDAATGKSTAGADPFLQGFLLYPENLAQLLPPETVRFRLRHWLRDGCEIVNSELRRRRDGGSMEQSLPPTLLVASDGDRLLDSKNEAKRLKPSLSARCGDKKLLKVVELKDAGHAPLDDRVDLAALIKDSPIFEPPKKRTDYVGEYKAPSLEQLEEGSRNVEFISSIVSPVFCSWDASEGRRRFGLQGIPDPSEIGRPVILVGNHQLLALDLGPLVREFLIEKGFAPRGLAHPVNFPEVMADMISSRPEEPESRGLLDSVGIPFELRAAAKASLEAAANLVGNGDSSRSSLPFNVRARQAAAGSDSREVGAGENFGLGGGFAKWGAVPVTPRNFYSLLQRNEAVLLFPGGAREACHGPGEKYQLFWPEKTDFVRLAARFNAIIVPFGGVGSADNVTIQERRQDQSKQPGRNGLKVEGGGFLPVSEALQEPLGFPNVFPRLPPAGQTSPGVGDRFYFSFGNPVDLGGLDPKDKEACDATYGKIRADVESEIAWLLQQRVKDPYRDFVKRQVFERVANLDDTSRKVKGGPLKGEVLHSCGRRAPSFEL
eukprot:TRINITY_DN16868_c0_g1_i1.p1 TRINITY_DN16868_c0_g1~~TRINITY_DN16868_c0_g1_i1.p1  ORF type:complete len:910 (-),score=173.94 TRINITY_DN16868_c0_g1_i1:106-2814(-)